VFLRAESKAVHVDTSAGSAAMVLVRLYTIKVAALTLSESVLAVELELGNLHRVLTLAADTAAEDGLGEQVVDTRLELRLDRTKRTSGIYTNPAGRLSSIWT
jgi:hypothetical protein